MYPFPFFLPLVMSELYRVNLYEPWMDIGILIQFTHIILLEDLHFIYSLYKTVVILVLNILSKKSLGRSLVSKKSVSDQPHVSQSLTPICSSDVEMSNSNCRVRT